MRENPLAAGAPPRRPRWGTYSARPDPLDGGELAGCPLSKDPTPALGLRDSNLRPSGLAPWSLPPQIRLPKSVYVPGSEMNLF